MAPQPLNSPWRDPANDTRLRALWADGLSAGQIATELGQNITRNAIIGRVHRLGLQGRKRAVAMQKPEVQRLPRAPGTGDNSILAGVKRKAVRVDGLDGRQKLKRQRVTAQGHVMTVFDEPLALTDLPADESPDAVTFLARKPEQCAWPLNDVLPIAAHMSCGSPRDGEHAYCPRHHRLSVQAPRATRELSDEVRVKLLASHENRQLREHARAFGGR